MIAIVTLDDRGGMLFNRRRQSRDAKLCDRILLISKESRLWISSFSAKLFEQNNASHVAIDDNFLGNAMDGEYCFVENQHLAPFESRLEKIIVYKWNRKYPGDFYFDIPLVEHGWKMVSTTDLEGKSHECITEEVYER